LADRGVVHPAGKSAQWRPGSGGGAVQQQQTISTGAAPDYGGAGIQNCRLPLPGLGARCLPGSAEINR
jgi:hypothetical protein